MAVVVRRWRGDGVLGLVILPLRVALATAQVCLHAVLVALLQTEAASTAPTMGPAQYTKWSSSKVREATAGPRDLAGLRPQPV